MPKIKLTKKSLAKLCTAKAQEDFFDETFSNFGVRAYRSGKKSFFYLYYDPDNRRRRRADLGDASVIGLDEAYAKAHEYTASVERGKDPLGRNRLKSITVKDLCQRYLDMHARPNKRPSSIREDERHINRYVLPMLGSMKAEDVRKGHICPIIDELGIAGKKALANRVRALIHGIFNFAVARDLTETNPCLGVGRYKEKSRDRVLSEDEIRSLFSILQGCSALWAAFYQMLLYTGQRPGEVSRMRWDEISGPTWTIPAHKSKNGVQHNVYLADPAVELLGKLRETGQTLKQLSRKSEKSNYDVFVFPSRYGGSLGWCNYNARALVRRMNVPRWTPHDLRRTMATHLEERGVASDVIDRMLNHTKQGVTAIYQRGHRWKECCEAWEGWAEFLFNLVGHQPVKMIHSELAPA